LLDIPLKQPKPKAGLPSLMKGWISRKSGRQFGTTRMKSNETILNIFFFYKKSSKKFCLPSLCSYRHKATRLACGCGFLSGLR